MMSITGRDVFWTSGIVFSEYAAQWVPGTSVPSQ